MAYDYKKNNPYEEDEQNGIRNNKAATPNYTYWDTWWAANSNRYTGTWVSGGGNFQYNSSINTNKLWDINMLFWSSAEQYESQNPWYLEKRNNAIANALYNEWKTDRASVENYLNTFSGYSNYDKAWQQNTVDAIMNRIWSGVGQNNGNNTNSLNAGMMNDMGTNYNNYKNGYSNLMWGSSNYASNFDEAVLNKLRTAYWIESLDEFKQRYPEQYNSLMQSLETVRPVRDATNPTQRQMLDGQLQWIIGTWVGAWSDWSKLNVLESSIMNKFQNPEQIKQDAQNILKLQTEWRSIPEIAERMWMSEDQVQQLVLLANGLDSKAWEYYQLTDKAAKDITEPYDKKLDRAEIEKNIALERANRQVERLKQDFDTNMERQQKANEVNLHNADFISWQYGYWFSKRGIEWLQYTAQQAQNIIDDLCKNYDRNNQQLADWIADIIRNWEWYNEDITEASEEALTQAKNNYTSNMLAIQQQYWTVGLQAQQQLSQNVQSFITSAENIYDNMLQQQQQNLTNLITNASNINALSMQNLTLRQAKIEQFQNESLNLNRNQLQNLADQLWMDKNTYQDLVNYQVQAVANQLNGYVPWAWVQMQQQIQSYLDQWYTPNQAMQMIMNSADFQAMQGAWWWNGEWKITWDYMYNSATWEWQNLAWGGGMWWDTNYVTSQTINWQTYWVSQKTIQWLQNFYNQYVDAEWNVIKKWWQCGAFVNDYLQSLWLGRVFKDPIDAKKTAINTPDWYKWQVGDIIVMDSPYASTKKYGHVAIITWVNADWSFTTLESNKKWEWNVFSRTIDPKKTKIHGYYHPDGVSAWWNNMSDYDMNTATMRIGRMAYWKNISEWEWKRVEETLKAWMSAGKSTNEILYDILWMTITNNQNVANPFIDIMVQNSDADWLSAYNVQWFSDFINKWKFTQAMNLVEQAVAKERGWDFSKNLAWYENGAKYAYEKWNEIIDLINKESNKLWIVAGNVNKLRTKFVKDKDFQKIKSAIVNYVTDWRHEMLGAATTETELKMIDDLLPAVTDNPFNAITKIEEFQDYWLRKYNNTRGNLYLPVVDENSLLDKNKRLNLYMWVSSTWRGNLWGGGSMSWWWGRG